ncbi:arginine N-succinyltransferase, partial [Alishewanella sp. SMS9]|nr:arginine N-succinyltransferase [Alishewanella sp. SMS9]
NAEGKPPFWNWLQNLFLTIDFPTADKLIGVGKKAFIAELMPRHPIYVGLLPTEAQQVIGQVHEQTRPALALLESEGFSCRGYVDIFDAGPTVEARISQIRAIRDSQRLQVRIAEATGSGEAYMICNTTLSDFRACWAELQPQANSTEISIPAELAKALQVNAGEWVRISKL